MRIGSALTPNSRGYLIAIIGTVLWSFTGVFISFLTSVIGMPVLVLAVWRDALVVMGLAFVFLIFNRSLLHLERKHFGFILVYGFFLSLYNALWTLSVKLNGAAISTVLIYGSPAITAFLERWLFAAKIDGRKYLAIAISIVGVIFVAEAYNLANWTVNFWGIVIGVLSGLGFSVYSLMGRAAAGRELNSWTTLLYTFGVAAVFLFFFDMLTSGTPLSGMEERLLILGDSKEGWVALIFLALGPTIGGYGLYTLSLRYLQATVSNLIATLEPPLTTLWAYLLLGERLSPAQIFGSALILGSVVLLKVKKRKMTA